MSVDVLKEKVKEFPKSPGVYLMKNKDGKILYVGKAKVLRERVRSYFTDSKDHSPKTKLLVAQIRDVEFCLTKTEVEAFLLEATLIKKHRPKYNIRLKDDRQYPYIKLSWSDEFPRLYLSRKVKKDGSLYFGPYASGGAVFGTIRFLNRSFRIRDCGDAMFKTRKRPCMTHQIGRCTAPCVGYVSEKDYRDEVDGARQFLRGDDKKVISRLEKKMRQLADEEKFEVAAGLRDSIVSIEKVLEKQTVINASSRHAEIDQDIVGFFGDVRGCLVETVHVRKGRVLGHRTHFLPMVNPEEDGRDWLVDFLNQYYEDNFIPDEVLVPLELGRDLTLLLAAVLKERAGFEVAVRYPTDERGRELLEQANAGASDHFASHVSKSEEKTKGLKEIQEKLGLENLPLRIECFDISHFQGAETVASQVVFEEGVPNKDLYRRYKIKTVAGVDDFASMKEVMERRFNKPDIEVPDLVVVDGGKGQLSAALKILTDIGRKDLAIVGLAKARTEADFKTADVKQSKERIFLPGRVNPVIFRDNSEAFRILVSIRDEAHRFAITYHRHLREATGLESRLDEIEGLGEARKKMLLTKFGSVEAIREAGVEKISELKGFSKSLAERIIEELGLSA